MTPEDLVELVGKRRGHFSSKANRIAKLIEEWPALEAKMESFIIRGGGQSEHARLAYAILLMMENGIRTGNESSAEGWICENQIVARKDNPEKGIKKGDIIWRHPMYGKHVQTYGLTTLLNKHIKKKRNKLEINFVGKKLVTQSLITRNPVLYKFCPSGDPDELFLGIDYYTLKKFVKKYVGKNYTPKDLRMTKVNLIFIEKFGKLLGEFEETTTKSGRKKLLATVIEETANDIGHTKSVCRSAYLSQPLINYLSSPPSQGDQS